MLCTLFVLMLGSAGMARASATLLLEEPYGKLGFFTPTGHAAVYLSGVCAETPLVLRRCAPGELGAVISRYDGVGGYDWVAIPLIPYLYAVERAEDIPLFADPKMVNFLRDQYRRKYLEGVAPDLDNGGTPGGNWYELAGSSYDRTIYAFEIETTSAQDESFIDVYNSSSNQSHFHLSYRNCADFAKDVINFYYPRALHRSLIADVGITTPKQIAKTMIKFSGRHAQLQFSRYVIPQVPGSAARSTAVHGVVESFLKSKKYIVPTAVASPIAAGCLVAVYVGTGAGRFDPARQALVFNAQRTLEPPLGPEDRRAFQIELNHLVAADSETSSAHIEKTWGRLMGSAVPGFDVEGRPVLRMHLGEETVSVGVTGGNIFAKGSSSSTQFAQQLLEARLWEELRRGNPPKVSENDIERDWNLLQKARNAADDLVTARSAKLAQSGSRWEPDGNRP
jgi:hypothetical protein